jgi:DNA-binding MarR family transcriptional regulator
VSYCQCADTDLKGGRLIPFEDRFPLGSDLRRAYYAYRLAMDRALEPIGVTVTQLGVLARLQATPGLSNAELARQTLVTPQTMNVILGRLEAAGLVERRPHPGHGRILLAELTPAGQAVLDRGLSRADAVEACALGALDPDARPLLLELLTRLGDAMAGPSPLPQPTDRVGEPSA